MDKTALKGLKAGLLTVILYEDKWTFSTRYHTYIILDHLSFLKAVLRVMSPHTFVCSSEKPIGLPLYV